MLITGILNFYGKRLVFVANTKFEQLKHDTNKYNLTTWLLLTVSYL